jgi:phosphate transport system substrate-binding protein
MRAMIKRFRLSWTCAATLFLFTTSAATAADRADPGLPEYQPVSGISGNFSSVGSDSLNNLMGLWAEAFRRHYPGVNIQISGAGSSTAPTALTEGTASFGPMSRAMKDQEIQAFEQRYGYPPTAVGVAVDALAIFVNQDNPLLSLSLPQVDAIFSATRRCGAPRALTHWGDLGLEGAWARRSISRYGRNSVSGTYGYFQERALCQGDFRNTVNELPGASSVVQAVATGLNAIGYSGIGHRAAGVRALPLARVAGETAVAATMDKAANGEYPLARLLYVYVNKAPNQPLAPMEREFLKLVLSAQGQRLVRRDGYVPLAAAVAERERLKLQ